ncbi:MAG TPA: FYDLN acid domain-containing protein [Myxococcales bacterium]|nr:FYDLN acid domain-containing protein [Myxococcales bacterium]
MARDLGSKYVCYKCGTKFYDLKKPVPACPKCGADQREAPVAKPLSARAARAAAAAPKEVEEPELPATDDEEAEDEEEDEKDED